MMILTGALEFTAVSAVVVVATRKVAFGSIGLPLKVRF